MSDGISSSSRADRPCASARNKSCGTLPRFQAAVSSLVDAAATPQNHSVERYSPHIDHETTSECGSASHRRSGSKSILTLVESSDVDDVDKTLYQPVAEHFSHYGGEGDIDASNATADTHAGRFAPIYGMSRNVIFIMLNQYMCQFTDSR